jgi:hypothetical protein
MIATRLYKVQALILTEKKDKHGRNTVDWTRIYCQVNNGTFEYTSDENQAKVGDFEEKIPNCKAINQASKNDSSVRLIEQSKGKKKIENVKSLEVRIDENFAQDLNKLTNILDEYNKNLKEVGRPLLINLHSGRGVSALSRGIDHSNYRGIVTVLLILLIISNLKYILKQGTDKGWTVGHYIYETVTNPGGKVSLDSLLHIGFAMHFFAVVPVISFLTEKLIAPISSIPRIILFSLIFLNMIYVLVFPVYYIREYKLHPLGGCFYLMFACIWFFKFLSYHHIWHDVRYHVIKANKIQDANKSKKRTDSDSDEIQNIKTEKIHRRKITISKADLGDKLNLPSDLVDEVLSYPSNVRAYDVWMFLLIPTLCFQLKYPFYSKINIKGFIYRMTE